VTLKKNYITGDAYRSSMKDKKFYVLLSSN